MSKPINRKALREAVREAAQKAFAELRSKRAKEKFYAFALYTSHEASYLVPAANTEEGLKRQIAKSARKDLDAEDLEFLRWNPPDWAYHGQGEKHFARVQKMLDEGPSIGDMDDDEAEEHLEDLMKTFLEGLRDLGKEGFFGKGKPREEVVLLLTMGDQELNFLLECAKKLNPPNVYKRFAAALKPKTAGKFSEIGSRKVDQMQGVGLSQDGKLLATVGDDFVFAFRLPGNKEILCQRTGKYSGGLFGIECCVLAPDGSQLAVGWTSCSNEDSGIERWSMAEGKRLPAMPLLKDDLFSLDYSPDSRMLASSGADQVVRLWDAASGELIRALKGHKGWVSCVRFSTDGKLLASLNRETKALLLWDVATGKRIAALPECGPHLAFSPDGKSLAVVSGDDDEESREVHFWNLETRKLTQRLEGFGHNPEVLAFSPDGCRLATGASFPGTAELWDVKTSKRLARLDPDYETINGLVFLKDGKSIAVTGEGMSRRPILLWDISSAGG